MNHTVLFDNTENHWDNALPLGNGTFGCMLFFEKEKLHMPMNHYEVYYNISDPLLPADKLSAMSEIKNAGEEHRRKCTTADESVPGDDGLYTLFRSSREAVINNKSYGIFKFSETFPQTGELVFSFNKSVLKKHSLSLSLEEAKASLRLEGNNSLTLDTIVTRRDCIINSITQSKAGLLKTLEIAFPHYRDSEPQKVNYTSIDSRTVLYTVKWMVSEAKEAVFTGIIRFVGAEASILSKNGDSAVIKIEKSKKKFDIITGIFTDWRFCDTDATAISGVNGFEEELDRLKEAHSEYWKEFFERSTISLPDKFLEKIYLINQYALDCCSGKDGVMKHQACGLNGLWAIRHPNLWGSKWYWDVNIQAAFAGVFSSNRLDLARVFSDGLMTYAESAKRHAKEIHGMSGMSIDYPYDFYYSCFVWCAQYMWYLYEYSLDKDYLKNEAYPVFLQLCEFSLQLFEYDEKTDTYFVYPDVSPEQGPLTHNSVITVSCVKYLFEFTLEAAKLLGDNTPMLKEIEKVKNKLPTYPTSGESTYGVHLRDSDDSPDNLWIRHPSMLMPVFPIGEINLDSDEKTKEIILNTINYLKDRCEIGIFGCSWIAAAAARMGKGNTALRFLYERGIDHLLRSNGLTAEETDHFINYCLIARQPLYYPCMMEFSGEMLAAVNEMLIQSHGGIIRLFPAIPDGKPDYEEYRRRGMSIGEYLAIKKDYPAWDNVSFSKLLAKGAFEVSAELKNSVLEGVSVLSKKGGTLKISSEFFGDNVEIFCDGRKAEFERVGNTFTLETVEGKTYIFNRLPSFDETCDNGIITHTTYTKRTISIGESAETLYQKKLDRALRDWYFGNARMSNHTVYKFDFTNEEAKDYAPNIPLQRIESGDIIMSGMDFVRTRGDVFTDKKGYGFNKNVKIVSRDFHDVLRRDFAEGDTDTEFIIEAPRGQYELLVISGDACEDSVTVVSGENSRKVGGKVIPAGEFQCELLPIIQEYDEPIVLKLSTKKGYKWKLSAIIMNMIKGY
ncbi:MAG: hypothetical protein E7613_06555 [Ruminococcaceae bacterium]|nr:hypothetical protein [Oscillospiraceae bacterium]